MRPAAVHLIQHPQPADRGIEPPRTPVGHRIGQSRVAAVFSRDNNLGSLGSGARERRFGVVADPPGVGDRSLLFAIDAQQVVC